MVNRPWNETSIISIQLQILASRTKLLRPNQNRQHSPQEIHCIKTLDRFRGQNRQPIKYHRMVKLANYIYQKEESFSEKLKNLLEKICFWVPKAKLLVLQSIISFKARTLSELSFIKWQCKKLLDLAMTLSKNSLAISWSITWKNSESNQWNNIKNKTMK